ncbi:MAG: NUDIX domain-containing protein, partial [Oscillospiraceae bacterium]|nr:NUDIX domain-containing protein [Oscillospiraceae bacterium]
DVEDKWVVAPEGQIFTKEEITAATYFQEQYFDYTVDSLFRKSCGVLPYRNVNGYEEYLIVFQSFSQCWSLPKGHMERGETEVQTALRELYEETGLIADVDTEKTATIEYPLSPISKKQVVFFRGEVSGEIITREGEIERFKWVRAEELKDYLFPDTVKACMKLIERKA